MRDLHVQQTADFSMKARPQESTPLLSSQRELQSSDASAAIPMLIPKTMRSRMYQDGNVQEERWRILEEARFSDQLTCTDWSSTDRPEIHERC
eukprot:gene10795-16944_t